MINIKYPTKKEILENLNNFENNIKDIEIIKNWKENNYTGWKNLSGIEKRTRITDLIKRLASLHKRKVNIIWDQVSYYMPSKLTISLEKDKPSILTALHEFGHHIYGESELTACSYSICMYIKVFPEIYEKMTWQNHLLILKN